MASSSSPASLRRDVPPPFGGIVCSVDGSRSAHLAVEQSIALCGPSTALVFVCVRDTRGAGATRQSTISAERADDALREAVKVAREAGIDAAAEVLSRHDPRGALLDEAARSDLLVVPSHVDSRAGGIALGSMASAALHRARVPVLVARRPPEGVAFPERILVATDGSADAGRALELTARIGHRHGSSAYVLSVEPGPHDAPKQIAADAANMTAELGADATLLRASGHAEDHILEIAASQSVSLVVLGSRGLTGVRALGSVSERVAHRAQCSVLVARPGGS